MNSIVRVHARPAKWRGTLGFFCRPKLVLHARSANKQHPPSCCEGRHRRCGRRRKEPVEQRMNTTVIGGWSTPLLKMPRPSPKVAVNFYASSEIHQQTGQKGRKVRAPTRLLLCTPSTSYRPKYPPGRHSAPPASCAVSDTHLAATPQPQPSHADSETHLAAALHTQHLVQVKVVPALEHTCLVALPSARHVAGSRAALQRGGGRRGGGRHNQRASRCVLRGLRCAVAWGQGGKSA